MSTKTTIRAGMVRVWNVYAQGWTRLPATTLLGCAGIMASLSAKERARVERAARR